MAPEVDRHDTYIIKNFTRTAGWGLSHSLPVIAARKRGRQHAGVFSRHKGSRGSQIDRKNRRDDCKQDLGERLSMNEHWKP